MRKLIVLLVVAAIICVGCGQKQGGEVSLADAMATLDTAVSYAQAHDLIGLGTLADDLHMTVRMWSSFGEWTTLPHDPPTVVGNFTMPDKLGGRVLVLEGIDGLGKPYHSEFLVYWYNGQLTVGNVIYWSGSGMGGVSTPSDDGIDQSQISVICQPQEICVLNSDGSGLIQLPDTDTILGLQRCNHEPRQFSRPKRCCG